MSLSILVKWICISVQNFSLSCGPRQANLCQDKQVLANFHYFTIHNLSKHHQGKQVFQTNFEHWYVFSSNPHLYNLSHCHLLAYHESHATCRKRKCLSLYLSSLYEQSRSPYLSCKIELKVLINFKYYN